jgi:hypothetical protein
MAVAGTGSGSLDTSDAGNIKKAVEIALDIDQPLYEVTTQLNPASLINRIQDT